MIRRSTDYYDLATILSQLGRLDLGERTAERWSGPPAGWLPAPPLARRSKGTSRTRKFLSCSRLDPSLLRRDTDPARSGETPRSVPGRAGPAQRR